MYEKFLALPQEKQRRILNAAMEIFSKHEYKRASTDDMAAKAGISKGLLFYYFKDKKSLYLYLFEHLEEFMRTAILDEAGAITDFFALMELGAVKKAELMEQWPYLMDFAMRAYYSENETISQAIHQKLECIYQSIYGTYFSQIDWSKFKEGVDPQYLLQMLTWMADGYLHEQQRSTQPPTTDEIMTEFHQWTELFRSISYKEEYL